MVLAPMEWLYRGVWFLWDYGYRKGSFPIHQVFPRVISIGNLTWGGTGKTPLAAYLAKRFQEKGRKVALLSRGYASPQDRHQADEVVSLKKALGGVGFFPAPNRVNSARRAQREGYQTVLLDDGFQHRRLARHLDIVTIDATDPFGNGHLIPAGKLREPLQSLKRTDWVVLTKTDLVSEMEISRIKEKIRQIAPSVNISETFYRPVGLLPITWVPRSAWDPQAHERGNEQALSQDDKTKDIDFFKGKPVGLVAAIGNPEAFKKTVEKLGARVIQTYFKRDHARYTANDLKKMAEFQKEKSIFCWVTTSKDAVKMGQALGLADPRLRREARRQAQGPAPTVYELEIELVFKKGEKELWQVIESL